MHLFFFCAFCGNVLAMDPIDKCIEAESVANYGEAVKCYESLYKRQNNNTDIVLKLAMLYENKIGENEKAIRIVKTALKSQPYNLPLNVFLMNIYYKNRDKNNGDYYYRKAANTRGVNDVFTIPPLALYWIKMDLENEEYTGFIKQAITVNPSDYIARGELARIYISNKKFLEAENELLQVLEYDKSDGEVYFNLGLTNYFLNKYKNALDYFEMAKMLGFNFRHEYIDEAKKHLNAN